MIVSITAVAGAGSVNIWLPVALKPGSRLKVAAAGDLTTANQTVALYLAPSKFIAITQDAGMPSDTLAECCCLKTKTQESLSHRTVWTGDIQIDKWSNVVAALFVNCTAGDRVQLAIEAEDAK